MQFSIITPSFRNSEWLKLCIPSVADQDVELEHIVQDSCSDDGTQQWLGADRRVRAFIEKDAGMYDAVNRGLARSTGDILAYLNCDEQYLPGALALVQSFFTENPGTDVVFADALVVDPLGKYLCHRQASIPNKFHSRVSGNLSVLTCATFFRQRLINPGGLWFDSQAKARGDVQWILELIQRRVPMALLGKVTSTFTETGNNLCLQNVAETERAGLVDSAPFWVRKSKFLFVLHHRLRRLIAGHYRPKPLSYSIYTQLNPLVRTRFSVAKPTFRWKR